MGKKFLFNPIEGTFDIVAGEYDYLQASKANDQVNISTDDDVIFDFIDRSSGSSISLNTPTGVFTLSAGKTYKLTCGIRFENTEAGKIGFTWYNKTASSIISERARLHNMFESGAYSSLPVIQTIITPTVETEVTVRCTWEGGNGEDVNTGFAWAAIEKISESVYNVATMGFNDQTASKYFDIGTMRIQWGRVSSTMDGDQTVTFPVAFGSAPVVTTSMERDSNAGYGAVDSVTATNFVFNRVDTIDNADNPFIIYIAIGLKP